MKRKSSIIPFLFLFITLLYSSVYATKVDTTLAGHWFSRAVTFYGNALYDSSLAYFEKALPIFERAAADRKNKRLIARMVDTRLGVAKNQVRKRAFTQAKDNLNQIEQIIGKQFPSPSDQQVEWLITFGTYYMAQSDYINSIAVTEKAVQMTIDLYGEQSLPTAKALGILAGLYGRKGELDKGIELRQQSGRIIAAVKGEDCLDYGEYLLNLSSILYDKGEYNKAIPYGRRGLEMRKKYWGEKSGRVVDATIHLGVLFYMKGEYDEALSLYDQGMNLAMELFGPHSEQVANLLNNIGILYFERGYFDRAYEYFNRALQVKLAVLEPTNPGLANSYNNIGNVHAKRIEFEQALAYYRKALDIRLASLKPNHPTISGSYQKIGSAYQALGDLDRALDYYNKSLDISLKAYGPTHAEISRCYVMMGEISLDKNEPVKALDYAQKALQIDLSVMGANHPVIPHRYGKIGDIYRRTGALDSALVNYQKGLHQLVQLFGPMYYQLSWTLEDIAEIHYRKGAPDSALVLLQRASEITAATFGEHNPHLASLDRRMAEIRADQKQWQPAFNQLQFALTRLFPAFKPAHYTDNPQLEQVDVNNGAISALYAKADILQRYQQSGAGDLHDLQAAVDTYELSARAVERVRSGYETEGSKLDLEQNSRCLYDAAVAAACRLYDATHRGEDLEKAFSFCEKAKAAVLWESLQDTRAKHFGGLPDSVMQYDNETRAELTRLETLIRKELAKSSRDSTAINEWREKRFDLSEQYQAFVQNMENSYPRYAEMRYRPLTSDVAGLRRALDERTVLLNYYITDESLYCFLVGRNKFTYYRAKIDSGFDALTETFHRSIKKIEKHDFLTSGRRLYSLLIKPAEKELTDADNLVIIPHGHLYKIPFDVLVSDQTGKQADYARFRYLIQKYPLTYHYSASLYARARSGHERENQEMAEQFVGFAPVFSDSQSISHFAPALAWNRTDSSLRSISVDGKHFNALPFSRDEVNTIVDQFNGAQKRGVGYFDQQASETTFKENVGRYRYVHVATHGFINELTPQLSGLVFSDVGSADSAEDGVLYAGETFNLTLSADLVVLSSCESGMGKLATGEGLMSLTRGFLYSGADNIIVSLWKVSDKHTRDFMIDFYRQVLAGQSYSQAMRTSKLAMIRNPATAIPRIWSGYVLIGH